MQILDGQLTARTIKENLKIEVAAMVADGKKIPPPAAVLVGNNGGRETYGAAKVKACAEIGFKSTMIRLEDTISETKLLSVIEELNGDMDVDGILVQLPL